MAIFSQIETGRGTRGKIVAGSWFQCQPVFVYSGYFDHSYFLPTQPRQWNWSTIINSSTWETCCTTCELTLLICPSGDGTELSLPRFPGVLGPNFDLKQTCLARAVSVSPIVCVFLPTVKSWRNTHVYCFHPLANRNQRKKNVRLHFDTHVANLWRLMPSTSKCMQLTQWNCWTVQPHAPPHNMWNAGKNVYVRYHFPVLASYY